MENIHFFLVLFSYVHMYMSLHNFMPVKRLRLNKKKMFKKIIYSLFTLFYNIGTITIQFVTCSLYTFDLYVSCPKNSHNKLQTIIDITTLFHLRIDCTEIVNALIDWTMLRRMNWPSARQNQEVGFSGQKLGSLTWGGWLG